MEGATYEQLTTDLVVLVPAHDEVKGRESREDGYGGRRRRLDCCEERVRIVMLLLLQQDASDVLEWKAGPRDQARQLSLYAMAE